MPAFPPGNHFARPLPHQLLEGGSKFHPWVNTWTWAFARDVKNSVSPAIAIPKAHDFLFIERPPSRSAARNEAVLADRSRPEQRACRRVPGRLLAESRPVDTRIPEFARGVGRVLQHDILSRSSRRRCGATPGR